MTEQLIKVAIVNGICVDNDAISASVRDDAMSFSREHGFVTKVFVYDNKLPELDAVVVRGVNDILFHPFFIDADLIIYHFGIYYELFNAILVGNGHAPQVVRYHNLTPRSLLPRTEWPLAERSRLQLHNMTFADAVWPVSDINCRELIDDGIVPAEKVEMIPLCVGDGTRRRSLADKDFDVIRLLFVGRFVKSKGLADLLQAVASLRDEGLPVHLRLVGEQRFSHPDYIKSLKALVTELDLWPEVTFVGGVSDEKLLEEYDEAHILVLPSYHEGFCKPVIEAMRSGCIPVTYDAYNLKYVARGLSLTAPTGDVAAFTERVRRLAKAVVSSQTIPVDYGVVPAGDYETQADEVLTEYGFPATSERLRELSKNLIDQQPLG